MYSRLAGSAADSLFDKSYALSRLAFSQRVFLDLV